MRGLILFVFIANIACQIYTGFGVDLSVPLADLENYNICYLSGYDQVGISMTNLATACVGSTFIMACRSRTMEVSVGVLGYSVVATISDSVFGSITAGTSETIYDNATGIYFYDRPNSGIGISDSASVNLGFQICDTQSGAEKICWRVDNINDVTVGGNNGRCGSVTNLNSPQWEQWILHDPCDGLIAGAPCVTVDQCWQGLTTCQVTGGTPALQCRGTSYTQCPATNQCEDPTRCNVQTGACNNPPRTNALCNSTDPCIEESRCSALKVCEEIAPIICNPPTPGLCVREQCILGTCTNVSVTNGTVCNANTGGTEFNPCAVDACVEGECVGGQPRACPARQICENAGTCVFDTNLPNNGGCQYNSFNDGVNCTVFNNLCVDDAVCASGACVALSFLQCNNASDCVISCSCDAATGEFIYILKPENSTCDDGDGCSIDEFCVGINCIANDVLECFAANQCLEPLQCTAGACPLPIPYPTTTRCDPGIVNYCFNYFCDGTPAGNCLTGAPVVCPAVDPDCEIALPCSPTLGCQKQPTNQGGPCTYPDPCVLTATCNIGVCTPQTISTSNVCQNDDDAAATLSSIFD